LKKVVALQAHRSPVQDQHWLQVGQRFRRELPAGRLARVWQMVQRQLGLSSSGRGFFALHLLAWIRRKKGGVGSAVTGGTAAAGSAGRGTVGGVTVSGVGVELAPSVMGAGVVASSGGVHSVKLMYWA
jgi:hypothetical protein